MSVEAVDRDGEVYRIRFSHSNPHDGNGVPLTLDPRYTSCSIQIKDGSGWNTLATGVAHCHPKDNFSKKLGRRKSFERAINAMAYIDHKHPERSISLFFENERTLLWQAFLRQEGILKTKKKPLDKVA